MFFRMSVARHLSGRTVDILVGGLIAVASAALLAPAFLAAGSEFDEGIIVSFPSMIIRGEVPYRDFESFYGPGGAYSVAGAFELFGSTLASERAVGLVFRLLLVVAIYWALLPWKRAAAVGGGVITAVVLAASGVSFDSYPTALAFGILAVAVASRSGDRSRAGFVLAGLLAGLAGMFRLEATAETLVALVPLLVGARLRRLSLVVLGLLVGLLPYLPLAIAAGTSKIERNYEDLTATGHARRLPISLSYSTGRLALGLALALALLGAAIAVSFMKRLPHSRLILALGILAAVQIPFAWWRFDAGHVGDAAILAFATIPVSLTILFSILPARFRPGFVRHRESLVPLSAACGVLLCLAAIGYTRDGLVSNARLAFGRLHSTLVTHNGRDFRVANVTAGAQLQKAISLAGRLAPRGGSLFVGPSDLRRMNGNDAFVYYMLPNLRPASFYVEADPPASRSGSGLAGDLTRADVLILGHRWNADWEANGTQVYGSAEPNRVVRQLFCRRGRFGGYEVLTRCR